VAGAARHGEDYLLTLGDGREVRGDRLLVAAGRRPRLPAGLDRVGVAAGPCGIAVDARPRAGERMWAIAARLVSHRAPLLDIARPRREECTIWTACASGAAWTAPLT
jgi:hypothetical protein